MLTGLSSLELEVIVMKRDYVDQEEEASETPELTPEEKEAERMASLRYRFGCFRYSYQGPATSPSWIVPQQPGASAYPDSSGE